MQAECISVLHSLINLLTNLFGRNDLKEVPGEYVVIVVMLWLKKKLYEITLAE
jgi:hypothetical protein